MLSAPALETGSMTAPSKPRVSKFLAAGVAVVGASAIAITPVSPVVDVKAANYVANHMVELTASAYPTYGSDTSAVYGNLLSESGANIANLFQVFASDPFPIINQLAANQLAYGQKILSGLAGIPAAMNSWWTGANGKALFEQAAEHLRNGEYADAWDRINRSFVYSLNIGAPLYNAFWSQAPSQRNPQGNMGIPDQMALNFQQVVKVIFDRNSIVNEITKSVLGPFMGVAFEFALLADAVSAAVKEGDGAGLVRALVNAPGVMLNTFLNGYVNPECTGNACEQFPGLINATSAIVNILSGIPKAIAEALQPDPVPGAPWTPPATATLAADDTVTTLARSYTLEVAPATATVEGEQSAEVAPVAEEAAPVVEEEATETPVSEDASAGTDEEGTETTAPAVPADDKADADADAGSKDDDAAEGTRKSGKPSQSTRSSAAADKSDSTDKSDSGASDSGSDSGSDSSSGSDD